MSNATDIFPKGLSLLGGIPLKSQDHTISIIFALVYLAILPIAIWRVSTRASRCWALLRPVIFVVLRIITFIIRTIQAGGNYSTGLFTAEQILLLCGFVLLCEPLITLLGCHITRYSPPSAGKTGTTQILRLLRLALMIALGLGAYAGTKFGDVNNNTSTLNLVKKLRDVNTTLCLVITLLAGIVVVVAHVKKSLPLPQTIWILVISLILTIASLYKISTYIGTPPSSTASSTKIKFYCFSSLPELIVSALYFSQNLNIAFDIDESERKAKESKLMAKTFDGDARGDYSMTTPMHRGDYA